MNNYEKLKQMTFDEMESEIKCLVRWLKPMPNTEIDYLVLKYLMSETRETNKRKLDKFVVVPKKEAERLVKEGNYKVFFDGEEYFLAKTENFDKDSVLCRYVLYSLEE